MSGKDEKKEEKIDFMEDVDAVNFECREFAHFRLPANPAPAEDGEKKPDEVNTGDRFSATCLRTVWPVTKSLIAQSNVYGITLCANPQKGGLMWCVTDQLIAPAAMRRRKDETKVQSADESKAMWRDIPFQPPGHFWYVAFNADESLVAVCFQREVRLYQTQNLLSGQPMPFDVIVIPEKELIMDFQWSQVTPSGFAMLMLAGTVRVFFTEGGRVTLVREHDMQGVQITAFAYCRSSDLMVLALADQSALVVKADGKPRVAMERQTVRPFKQNAAITTHCVTFVEPSTMFFGYREVAFTEPPTKENPNPPTETKFYLIMAEIYPDNSIVHTPMPEPWLDENDDSGRLHRYNINYFAPWKMGIVTSTKSLEARAFALCGKDGRVGLVTTTSNWRVLNFPDECGPRVPRDPADFNAALCIGAVIDITNRQTINAQRSSGGGEADPEHGGDAKAAEAKEKPIPPQLPAAPLLMLLTADARISTYSLYLENKGQPFRFMSKAVAMKGLPAPWPPSAVARAHLGLEAGAMPAPAPGIGEVKQPPGQAPADVAAPGGPAAKGGAPTQPLPELMPGVKRMDAAAVPGAGAGAGGAGAGAGAVGAGAVGGARAAGPIAIIRKPTLSALPQPPVVPVVPAGPPQPTALELAIAKERVRAEMEAAERKEKARVEELERREKKRIDDLAKTERWRVIDADLTAQQKALLEAEYKLQSDQNSMIFPYARPPPPPVPGAAEFDRAAGEKAESTKTVFLQALREVSDKIKEIALLRADSASALNAVMEASPAAQAPLQPGQAPGTEFSRHRVFALCTQTRVLTHRASELTNDVQARRLEVDRLHDALKEGVRKAENASFLEQQNANAEYRHLMEQQPLDPHSQRLLTHIQDLSRQIDQSVEDIEVHEKQLWEQINSKQQHLPSVTSIYTVLNRNADVLNATTAKLDRLEALHAHITAPPGAPLPGPFGSPAKARPGTALVARSRMTRHDADALKLDESVEHGYGYGFGAREHSQPRNTSLVLYDADRSGVDDDGGDEDDGVGSDGDDYDTARGRSPSRSPSVVRHATPPSSAVALRYAPPKLPGAGTAAGAGAAAGSGDARPQRHKKKSSSSALGTVPATPMSPGVDMGALSATVGPALTSRIQLTSQDKASKVEQRKRDEHERRQRAKAVTAAQSAETRARIERYHKMQLLQDESDEIETFEETLKKLAKYPATESDKRDRAQWALDLERRKLKLQAKVIKFRQDDVKAQIEALEKAKAAGAAGAPGAAAGTSGATGAPVTAATVSPSGASAPAGKSVVPGTSLVVGSPPPGITTAAVVPTTASPAGGAASRGAMLQAMALNAAAQANAAVAGLTVAIPAAGDAKGAPAKPKMIGPETPADLKRDAKTGDAKAGDAKAGDAKGSIVNASYKSDGDDSDDGQNADGLDGSAGDEDEDEDADSDDTEYETESQQDAAEQRKLEEAERYRKMTPEEQDKFLAAKKAEKKARREMEEASKAAALAAMKRDAAAKLGVGADGKVAPPAGADGKVISAGQAGKYRADIKRSGKPGLSRTGSVAQPPAPEKSAEELAAEAKAHEAKLKADAKILEEAAAAKFHADKLKAEEDAANAKALVEMKALVGGKDAIEYRPQKADADGKLDHSKPVDKSLALALSATPAGADMWKTAEPVKTGKESSTFYVTKAAPDSSEPPPLPPKVAAPPPLTRAVTGKPQTSIAEQQAKAKTPPQIAIPAKPDSPPPAVDADTARRMGAGAGGLSLLSGGLSAPVTGATTGISLLTGNNAAAAKPAGSGAGLLGVDTGLSLSSLGLGGGSGSSALDAFSAATNSLGGAAGGGVSALGGLAGLQSAGLFDSVNSSTQNRFQSQPDNAFASLGLGGAAPTSGFQSAADPFAAGGGVAGLSGMGSAMGLGGGGMAGGGNFPQADPMMGASMAAYDPMGMGGNPMMGGAAGSGFGSYAAQPGAGGGFAGAAAQGGFAGLAAGGVSGFGQVAGAGNWGGAPQQPSYSFGGPMRK